jgi:phosphoglycolate phosphatase-like HAD superfamily hydrolase
MKRHISAYRTLIFDCDGVVLDSNKVKTSAFYQATLPYGEAAAEAMVNHHVANGGVSRYIKFAYFLEQVVTGQPGPDLETLLGVYAGHVREGLLSCTIAPGLEALRRATPNARRLIVSGGDQAELCGVFAERGLTEFFDGGIFGSPDTKDEILARELACESIATPALFLGDSYYDYQAATSAGLDFVFIHGWSEVNNWERWCQSSGIDTRESIAHLIPTV